MLANASNGGTRREKEREREREREEGENEIPSLGCISFFSFPFFLFFSFLPSTRNCSAIIPRPECSTFRQLFPSSRSRAMSETRRGSFPHQLYERAKNQFPRKGTTIWLVWLGKVACSLVSSLDPDFCIGTYARVPHRGCAVESGYESGARTIRDWCSRKRDSRRFSPLTLIASAARDLVIITITAVILIEIFGHWTPSGRKPEEIRDRTDNKR